MYKVEFTNIGHRNTNFTKELEEITWDSMVDCVAKYCTSSAFSIWFSEHENNENEVKGSVCAGFHTIGQFRITKKEE
ncbi:hypothetical protein K5V21_13920 [Clostridium sardiniense]|uniref:Uncharacterized protein n=1 Tax=Clostridium sardiniense TaxID=29369 RepID=A0ABS7L0F8_CLOSR|nr:hypothetical protein [Clostridium sardiniense]MBY0756541.1 hypothetical protein [Clostridium sardiniense]MDQ0460290.1 hypothetical protein [Clostridium sardiniense]